MICRVTCTTQVCISSKKEKKEIINKINTVETETNGENGNEEEDAQIEKIILPKIGNLYSSQQPNSTNKYLQSG